MRWNHSQTEQLSGRTEKASLKDNYRYSLQHRAFTRQKISPVLNNTKLTYLHRREDLVLKASGARVNGEGKVKQDHLGLMFLGYTRKVIIRVVYLVASRIRRHLTWVLSRNPFSRSFRSLPVREKLGRKEIALQAQENRCRMPLLGTFQRSV